MAILRPRMRTGLVYYILLLLDMNDTVSIPRVGVLKKRVYPAKADLDKREIHPPHATIHFDPGKSGNKGLLARFVAHSTGISEELAIAHLELFSEEIISGLQSNGRAAIDHLGVFYKRDEEILFAPDTRTANLGFAGLETVNLPATHLPPVRQTPDVEVIKARSAVAAAVTVQHEQPPEEEPSGDLAAEVQTEPDKSFYRRVLWLAGLFVIAFLTVVVLALVNYNQQEESSYPTSAFNRAPMPDPIVSPTSDDTMSDTNSAEALPGEDTVAVNLSNPSEIETMEVYDPNTITLENVLELDRNVDKPNSGTEDEKMSLDEENGWTDGAQPVATEQEESTSERVASIRQCHVIVGAFGVNANVTRMVSRLESMGYSVDTMPRGNLTQVGVPAPCGSAEIELVLEELRSSVESRAWILKK